MAANAVKDRVGGRRAPREQDGRRIRRWSALALILVGLAALAGIAAGAVTTMSLQSDAARQEIRARLGALTGHPVTIDGTGGYSLLPVTRLSLSNVRIGNADAAEDSILRIDTVVADFDLWQALLGRARIEHLVLVRPEAESASTFLDPASGKGEAAPAAASAPEHYVAMSRALGSFLSRFDDVRTVEIRDGVFRMGPGIGFLNISNVNLTIAWPSPGSAARLSGDYVWNGEPTEIDVSVASPLAFLDGGRSALDVTMSAPPLSARFSGTSTLRPDQETTGRMALATPALSRAVRWLGNPAAPVPDVGALSIEADLVSRGQSVNLRNASVAVNGFSGQGAMEMMLGSDKRRTSIGGTLAFARFDLSAFVQAVAPIPETALGLQRKISLEFVDDLNLDIRISAAQATIGRIPVSDLAAALRFSDGTATVDVGDASLLGGRGQGRLTIDTRQRVPAAKATASLSGVDTARLLGTIGFGAIGVSGLSDISASATGPIPNWASFLKLGTLALDVAARGGTISGFDPSPYLVAGRRPLALSPSSAKIDFNRLKAKMQSSGSLLDVTSVDIAMPAGTLTAGGVLSILSNSVALEGAFAPMVDDAFTVSKPIAFKVSGEWPSPIVETGPPASPM